MAKRRKKAVEVPEIGGQEIDVFKSIDQYEWDAFKLVSTRMKQAKTVNDSLKLNWKKYDDMAHSRLDMSAVDVLGNNINLSHRSRICLPIVENGIRALVAKYIVSILVRRPWFSIEGIGDMDDEQAKRIEGALVFMFDKMPNFLMNMITFVQEMLYYGSAIGKVYWRKIVRKTKTGEAVEYEGIYFEPIHLEDFFIDPNATKIDGFWKCHRIWKTTKDLKLSDKNFHDLTGKNLYKNLDMMGASYSQQDDGTFTIRSDKQTRGVFQTNQVIPEYFVNELWEYWSEDNSRVIIVANQHVVIYDGANPNESGVHPFLKAVYEPAPFQFYGRGVCEKVKPLHDMLNTINNQIIDNVKLVNNPMYKAVINSVNVNQITSRSGKIIWCDDINSLVPMPIPSLSAQIFQLRDELISKIESSIAANAMTATTGQPIAKEQSATESAIGNRLGNEFHGLNLMMLEVPVLIEMLKKGYLMIQQYAGDEYAFKISDKEGMGFLHKDDWMDVNFRPKVGVDLMSSEVKMTTLTNMIANLKDVPGLTAELTPLLVEEAGKMLGIHLEMPKQPPMMTPQMPMEGPVGTPGMPGNIGPIEGAPIQ